MWLDLISSNTPTFTFSPLAQYRQYIWFLSIKGSRRNYAGKQKHIANNKKIYTGVDCVSNVRRLSGVCVQTETEAAEG